MNKSVPKIYHINNWSSYNQALINRGNILIWFDSNTQFVDNIGVKSLGEGKWKPKKH
jgi:hypothetical protein